MDSSKITERTKRSRSLDKDHEVDLSRISPEAESSSSSSDEEAFEIASTFSQKIKNSQLTRSREGVLIQHRIQLSTPINRREEVEESGLKMDDDFFSFTHEEDQIIRENWEKYAKFHKFNGSIFEFLGFDDDGLEVANKKPRFVSSREFNFHTWPKLCHGLDNRFAKLVRFRISYIFHPYYKENEEEYDLDDATIRIDGGESLSEVCESLKIPPRFIERHVATQKSQKKKDGRWARVEFTHRTLFLKFLYESVLKNAGDKFTSSNFNWTLFRKKCQENSIDPVPNMRTVNNTYRNLFRKADSEIFKKLTPPPTLRNKIIYMHEAFVRYTTKARTYERTSEKPSIKMVNIFTVVFEDLNKVEDWDPPTELDKYARLLDLPKIRERVATVRRKRQQLEDTPKPKYTVEVRKRKRLEGFVNKINKRQTSEELETSSTRHESSPTPTTSSVRTSEVPGTEETNTEFEFSTFNSTTRHTANTSSSFLNRNEPILAAGGAGIAMGEAPNDTSLGSINNQSMTQRANESIQLDMSQDIWAQLVS